MVLVDQTAAALLTIFARLPKPERFMLQLLAVFLEPINRASVAHYGGEVGIRDANSKKLSMMTASKILSSLEQQGLLLTESPFATRFWCNPLIAREVIRSAVADGRLEQLDLAAQKYLPAITLHGHARTKGMASWVRSLREINISVFLQDAERLLNYLQLIRAQFPNEVACQPPLVALCTAPFDPAWFCALPLPIQALALEEIVPHFLENLQDMTEIVAVLRSYRAYSDEQQGDRFRTLLVMILLMQGELAAAQELVVGTGLVESLAWQGGVSFLQGDQEQAIRCYDQALRELQQNTRDKKRYFSHFGGLFFILALLKSPDPLQNRRAEEMVVLAQRQGVMLAAPAYSCLAALFLARGQEEGRALHILDAGFSLDHWFEAAEGAGKEGGNQAKVTLLGLFFKAMTRYWIDIELARAHKRGLTTLLARARQRGYRWVALELAELLARMEEDGEQYRAYAAELRQQSGLHAVVPIMVPEVRWERALRAMLRISVGGTTDQGGRATGRRLVWLIRLGTTTTTITVLAAKEQTLGRAGRWSKGRVVETRRLAGGEDLDFLTDQDRRITQAIVAERAYYGVQHVFNWQQAMLAMVGHPLVFWYDAPAVNVEVVRVEPELLVQQEQDQVCIQFSMPILEQGVMVRQEAANRCAVIDVTATHQAMATILGREGLQVPLHGQERVLEVMHAVSPLVTIQSAIGSSLQTAQTIKTVPAVATLCVQLLPWGAGLKVRVLVRPFGEAGPYFLPGVGGQTIMAEVNGERLQTHRPLPDEQARASTLLAACPSLGGGEALQESWLFEEAEDCLQLLSELQSCADTIRLEWPEGEKWRITAPLGMEQTKLRIQRDQDWFALSGEVVIDESLVMEMGKLLELIEQSKSRFVPLGEGRFLALTEGFRKQLAELAGCSEQSGKGRRFHPLVAPLVQDLTAQAKTRKVDQPWRNQLQRFQKAQELQVELPSTLQVELRDYQLAGFQWLSRLVAWGVGACLADDMGLGKTLQALALVLSRAEHGPVLVVAPVSVCFNWLKEMQRFAPTLNGVMLGGPQRQQLVLELKPFDVLICSYGLLQQESEILSAIMWNGVILDEAQAIKNRGTKRSKAAMDLRAAFRLVLTGTPIENHLGELWNLFQFINPGLLGSLETFNERFAAPIERHGSKEARQRLKRLIQPFILRRLKSQVLEELPARTEITLHVEMSAEESAFYETLRRNALDKLDALQGALEKNQLQIFAEIMRLRRACCNSRLVMPDSQIVSSKLELFWSVLEELLENRHKVLVFSQFVDHLTLIRARLDENKVRYQYLDGSTPTRERQERVEAFQAGVGEVFLLSLRAGGLGINLTAADYVIHMDPWWNPAVEDQAADRAHRIGQLRPVTIYRLVTKGTIEEMIVGLHQHKRHLADGLLDGSDLSGKLSAAELLNLIRGQE